jgi:Zn-dependent protease with chaperone function
MAPLATAPPAVCHVVFVLFIAAFSLSALPAQAQYTQDYVPIAALNSAQVASITAHIESRKKLDLSAPDVKKNKRLREMMAGRSEWLLEHLNEGNFLYEPDFNAYVENILKHLLEANAFIDQPPTHILIDRNPTANALCTGEGILIVNIGLIRRMRNESQLAFVIAHELAHHHLDHVNEQIRHRAEQLYGTGTQSELKGNTSIQALDLLKSITYSGIRYSRRIEKTADSLGLMMVAASRYNEREALSVMNILDSADYPKYPYKPVIDSIFNFSDFPFRPEWLREQSAGLGQNSRSSFIFNLDSLKTHPHTSARWSELSVTMPPADDAKVLFMQSEELFRKLVYRSDFEVIESAFYLEDYGRCLFLALQGLRVYPDHPYLHEMIARVFVKLYEARRDHTFGKYVPMVSREFNAGMKDINTFLHNLRLSEIGAIGLRYLNSKNNFKQHSEEHYYLLWKLSRLTGDSTLESSVKKAYLSAFPNGAHRDSFFLSNPK